MIKFIFWCIATPVFIAIAWMIGYALWGIASSLRDTYCVRWVYRDGAPPRYGTNGTRPTADSSRPN